MPLSLFVAAAIYASAANLQSPTSTSRVLTCGAPFGPTASAASLTKVFGESNVLTDDIEIGEGETEEGTVLFGGLPEDRLEILWTDPKRQQLPRMVIVRASKSRWKARTGLTIGITLQTLERLNRRPFRLTGFGWDYGGTVMSWSEGSLDVPESAPCRIRARLTLGDRVGDAREGPWYRQVLGDKDFSSGHPAMQALNPVVYEVFMDYAR